jgi:uncharacterized OB-fold protein
MVKEEMIENCLGPARIAKKGEALILDEISMMPVEYLEPFCHGAKMRPIFTYKSENCGIYKQFRCNICGHCDSRLVAVPL